MHISEYDRDFVLAPNDYSNGFEVGPLVNYKLKPTIFVFTTGILYTTMHCENYRSYNLIVSFYFSKPANRTCVNLRNQWQ